MKIEKGAKYNRLFQNKEYQTGAWSVLVTKNFGTYDAYDAANVIQHDLTKIVQKKLIIKIPTDSETLFNVVIRILSNTERRIMNFIKVAREA